MAAKSAQNNSQHDGACRNSHSGRGPKADKVTAAVGPVDVAISPAVGGIIPGYETARHLGVPSMYVEREGGEFRLRRGFSVEPGEKVVMVEDIVTTGLSSRECIAAIQKAGGEVVAAACIVDRSGGRADVGVPLIALATLDVPAYPADALPPELAAFAFDVHRRDAQMAGGLVAGDDPADGGRDGDVHRADRGGDLLRQRLAQAGAAVGVHEHPVLLQEHRAVQAG